LAVQKLNEAPIKSLVGDILTNHYDGEILEDELLQEIIKWQKLDLKNAKGVFNAMKVLGLDACKQNIRYSISCFATMRNYFTEAEIKRMQDKSKRSRRRKR